jgi:dTMP kinase
VTNTTIGRLIALEGIDGSGKGTQAHLLVEALRRQGHEVEFFSFPAYRQTFTGRLIGTYLDGGLGDPRAIDSRLTALLYATDRFEMRESLRAALSAGHLVVCDRYVGSNLAHQVARAAPRRRPELRAFIETLEFDVFGLPRPDLVVLLDMPVRLAQARVLQKAARNYTHKKLDAAEADARHLKAAAAEYRHHAETDPARWCRVPTTSGRHERARDEIHADVLSTLRHLTMPSFAPLD